MSFLVELKRRNVLRVAAAYLIAAWLLIQVAETLFPLYGLSDSAIRLVVTLLVIGFAIALVVSWAFELTPEGLMRDKDVDRSQSIAPQTGKKLDRIIMVVLVLALGYFALDKFVLDPERDAEKIQVATEEAVEQAIETFNNIMRIIKDAEQVETSQQIRGNDLQPGEATEDIKAGRYMQYIVGVAIAIIVSSTAPHW